MQRILQSSTQRVEILRPHERGSDDIPMDFRDRFLTLDFLRRLTHNPLNMITLRDALAEIVPVTDISRLTDDEILQQFAWLVACKYFELVPMVEEMPRLVGLGTLREADSTADSSASSEADSAGPAGATETAEQPPVTTATPPATIAEPSETTAAPPATIAEPSATTPAPPVSLAAPEEETDWIEFRVVDDETDMPMSGIGLKIKLPTEEIKDYTTDANGIVRIDDLTPGTCDIVEITDPDAGEVVLVE